MVVPISINNTVYIIILKTNYMYIIMYTLHVYTPSLIGQSLLLQIMLLQLMN